MAKISRKTQVVFGSGAGGVGVTEYGSPATGTPAYSYDLDDIQTASWVVGWAAAALAGSEIPTYQDFNAIHYVSTSQLAYLLQEGVPEYDSGTEYHQNSIVKKAGTYELYGSKTNTNEGNALPSQTDNTDWQYLGDLADLKDAAGLGLLASDNTWTGTNTFNQNISISRNASPIIELEDLREGAESQRWRMYASGADFIIQANGTSSTNVLQIRRTDDTTTIEDITLRTPELSLDSATAFVSAGSDCITAKAWVNFTGTGTVGINDDYNVSSVTDLGTGRYQVNLTNAMSNTTPTVLASVTGTNATGFASMRVSYAVRDYTSSSFIVNVIDSGASGVVLFDSALVSAAVLGN